MGTPQPPWVACSSVWTLLQDKNIFLMFKWNSMCFLFVLIASFPVTGHHWEKSVCIFFIDSHQVFIHVDNVPLSFPFSRLTVWAFPGSLCMADAPIVSSSLWSFTGLIPVCPLLCWWAQNWTHHQRCLTTSEERGEITSLPLLANCSSGCHWPLPQWHIRGLCSTWCPPGSPGHFLTSWSVPSLC